MSSTYTPSSRLTRALVTAFRANAVLKAALTGGLHDGFSPEKIETYPMGVYNLVTAVNEDAWGSRMIVALVDVTIFSRSSVEADNLDVSMLQTLDGASLTVDGQTPLICRRISDLRSVDVDEEGEKVYGFGGSYEVWSDQAA